ncbi:hypothetical protein AVEN_258559-1 [Araneus ventricosus]|uniref:ATP-dependent DNA helicase n=1 Tax=Araneus ventricosus TaxID=182803 RepID=A0A4Y2F3S0_ARAVE|nr:hypothetical protein AVEN_258559-1 [Araneus ventricosus]
MGNLIAEENGEPLLLEVSCGTEKSFLINLILTQIQSKCHIALAFAPSRIAIRLLDGVSISDSPLELPLSLDYTENPISTNHKGECLCVCWRCTGQTTGLKATKFDTNTLGGWECAPRSPFLKF